VAAETQLGLDRGVRGADRQYTHNPQDRAVREAAHPTSRS
jgi:hypothetical protein